MIKSALFRTACVALLPLLGTAAAQTATPRTPLTYEAAITGGQSWGANLQGAARWSPDGRALVMPGGAAVDPLTGEAAASGGEPPPAAPESTGQKAMRENAKTALQAAYGEERVPSAAFASRQVM